MKSKIAGGHLFSFSRIPTRKQRILSELNAGENFDDDGL